MTCCCVPKCSETGVHKFPKDPVIRKLWLKAIRRPKLTPTANSRICRNHFVEEDYQKISNYTGVEHQHRYLKKNTIPSVFLWNTKPVSVLTKAREERIKSRNRSKSLFPEGPSTSTLSEEVVISNERVISISNDIELPSHSDETPIDPLLTHNNAATQTSNILRLFSTDLLYPDNEAVNFYTGLETHAKLSLVLSTLLPMASNLKYRWSRVLGLSVEDQFVILLMKLRRNKPDYELSIMFGISKTEVSNIVVTWINFVYDMWNLIDIWPSRELVDLYMPRSFLKNYPSTRVIIDGTEIPIQKPGHPDVQKATYSSCKYKNTMKILVGASPGGLFSFCSGAYAGSASDRQIVEQSELMELCEEGDSILADRGFNVQDLFAAKSVAINIPTVLKGKSQIPGNSLRHDPKLSSQIFHIQRLIGFLKTYKILTSEMNHFYVPLASKIFYICLMLCNFREGIVNKNK